MSVIVLCEESSLVIYLSIVRTVPVTSSATLCRESTAARVILEVEPRPVVWIAALNVTSISRAVVDVPALVVIPQRNTRLDLHSNQFVRRDDCSWSYFDRPRRVADSGWIRMVRMPNDVEARVVTHVHRNATGTADVLDICLVNSSDV